MDKTKNPGIRISGINLVRCELEMNRNPPDKLNYCFEMVGYFREEHGNELIILAEFDLMFGIKNPPFSLTCSFGAKYSRTGESNMTWDDFNDVFIVAHILPYVREFISSVTLRLPVEPLIIPPTNAHLMVQKYRERESGKKEIPVPLQ